MKSGTRVFLWLVGWVAALALLTLLGVSIAMGVSKSELQKYRASLESRGEKFTMVALAPPPAPTEGNGGAEVVKLGNLLAAEMKGDFLREISVIPNYKTVGYTPVLHRRKTAAGPKVEPTWEEVAAALEARQDRLTEFRRLAQSPTLAVDLDYSLGLRFSDLTIAPVQAASMLLAVDALSRLQRGDSTRATEDMITLLRLAGIVQRNPQLSVQMIYSSLEGFARALTWEILQSETVSGRDLEVLQSAWTKLPPANGAEMLRMERAQSLLYFNILLETLFSAFGGPRLPNNWSEAEIAAKLIVWKLLYCYSDERQFIESFQKLIDQIEQKKSWPEFFALAAEIEKSPRSAGPSRLGSQATFPSFQSAMTRIMVGELMRSLTITAIALRRYQLDHANALPTTLEELVPTYLAEVPRDTITAGPLRYRPEADGFLLYSVGLNGLDDGGDPTRDSKAKVGSRDIVWFRPAPESP